MNALAAHLHAWQQVAEKATPGPWTVSSDRVIMSPEGTIVETDAGLYPPEENDAAFIALARTAFPLLIQKCLQMQAALAFYHNVEKCEENVVGGEPCLDPVAHAALAPFDETPPQVGR